MMGEKDQARREMAGAACRLCRARRGSFRDEAAALVEAARIKYPVDRKASGRRRAGCGMCAVRNEEELPAAFGARRGMKRNRPSGNPGCVSGEISSSGRAAH